MTALIVDDEPHVITVARLLVDWEKFGISTVLFCGCAEDALRLIEEKRPEIVLSDIRMPGLNGLELIEKIRVIDPDIRTILITAYGDFSYAQKALQLGCVDYLLKPLTEEGLNDAVEKAVHQYAARHTLLAESSRGRAQNLLSLFLSSEHPAAMLESLCEIAPFFCGITQCRAGIICTRHLPAESIDLYSAAGLSHSLLFDSGAGAATLWGSPSKIVLLFCGNAPDAPALCHTLLAQLKERYGVQLHIGLSEAEAFPQRLDTALLAAHENAYSFNLLAEDEQVHLSAPPVPSLKIYASLETLLSAALFSGQPERMRQISDTCAKALCAEGLLTVRQLENFRDTYNSMRNKWIQGFLLEQGHPALVPKPFLAPLCTDEGRFDAAGFSAVLFADLQDIAGQYLHPAPIPATGDVLQKVHQYIFDHCGSDLSLDFLSEQFGISPAYLSRAFKKEFGIGLVDYITQVRIDRAKELIATSPLKLSEIALSLGFSDPKYFSRVFKRLTGDSPAEYRAACTQEAEQ